MSLSSTKRVPVKLPKDARLKVLGKYYEMKSKRTYTLEMQFMVIKALKDNHETTLYDLCVDVVNNIISPYLSIQSFTVLWTYLTLSIMKDTLERPFYSRIPLTRLHGRKKQEAAINKSLDIKVQYLESRQTNKLKVYGVSSDMFSMSDANYAMQKDLLTKCEDVLLEPIILTYSNVTVKYVKSVAKTDLNAKPTIPLIVTV